MILPDSEIAKAIKSAALKIEPFSENPYSGPYQDIVDLSAEDISTVTEGDNIGFAKMLDTMRALSKNVNGLAESVEKFTHQNEVLRQENKQTKWIIGFGFVLMTIFIALLGLLIALK